jgi:hypothetical protein
MTGGTAVGSLMDAGWKVLGVLGRQDVARRVGDAEKIGDVLKIID